MMSLQKKRTDDNAVISYATLPNLQVLDFCPDFGNGADDFMTGNKLLV
jgi:hypothetical protein